MREIGLSLLLSTHFIIAQGLRHLNVSEIVKERKCYTGRDEDYDAFIIDEDKLCDELEELLSEGGCIVDFHSVAFFPERWFDLVLVVRRAQNPSQMSACEIHTDQIKCCSVACLRVPPPLYIPPSSVLITRCSTTDLPLEATE